MFVFLLFNLMKNVIIDADVGLFSNGGEVDDGLALITALNCSDLAVRGISCSAGNVSAKESFLNTKLLLKLLNKDANIGVGCEVRPSLYNYFLRSFSKRLVRKNVKLEKEDYNVDSSYMMIEELEKRRCSIICLGPLTNLSGLLKSFPEVKERIENVFITAGAFGFGGFTPFSEFNAYFDALAFKQVISSEIPITLLTREAGVNVKLSSGELGLFKDKFVAEACRPWVRMQDFLGGSSLFDPVTVSCFVNNNFMLETKNIGLDVKTSFLMGMLVKGDNIVNLCTNTDANSLKSFIMQKLCL